MKVRRRAAVAAAIAVAVAGGACTNARSIHTDATPGKQIKQLPTDLLPGEVFGLKVSREDMSKTLANTRRSYVDAVGLYGLRKDDLLEATLQVSRLNSHADFESPAFRRELVGKIGASLPREVRVGPDTVYLSVGTKQTLSAWFRGRNLLVLAVRDEYGQPRALLRQALRLNP